MVQSGIMKILFKNENSIDLVPAQLILNIYIIFNYI